MTGLRERATSNFTERQENRKERYEELAQKNHKISDENSISNLCGERNTGIPMGQPILVGHHSEKRHRNHLKRIDAKLEKGFNAYNKAKHFEDKAASVGTGGIMSNDPEALIKLKDKLQRMEERRNTYKEFNKFQKREGTEKALLLFKDKLRPRDIDTVAYCGSFSGWPLTNLGAKIREAKKRIERIEKMDSMELIDFVVNGIEVKEEDGYINVYFEGKPSDETRQKIKGYGIALKWSRFKGCWTRKKTPNTGKYFIENLKNILEKATY